MLRFAFQCLALTLIPIIWFLHLWLLAIFLRLLLDKLSKFALQRYLALLQPWADAPFAAVQRRLVAYLKSPVPNWIPWAMLMSGLLSIELVLAWIVASLC